MSRKRLADAAHAACRERRYAEAAALRRAWRADVERARRQAAAFRATPDATSGSTRGARLMPGVLALGLHRLAHLLHARGWRRVPRLLAQLNLLLHRVAISPASCLGDGAYLPHPSGVSFHGRAGDELTLFARAACLGQGPLFFAPLEDGPRLGERVSVGVLACVLGPVDVGDGATVAPRTALCADLPPGATAVSRALRVVVAAP